MKKSLLALAVLLFTHTVQAGNENLSIEITSITADPIITIGDEVATAENSMEYPNYSIRANYNTQCIGSYCEDQSVRFALSDTYLAPYCEDFLGVPPPSGNKVQEYFLGSTHNILFSSGESRSFTLGNWSPRTFVSKPTSQAYADITLKNVYKKPGDMYVHARISDDWSACTTSFKVPVTFKEKDSAGITGLEHVNLNREGKGELSNVCIFSSTARATLDVKTTHNFKLKQDTIETGIPYSIKITTQNQVNTISEAGIIEELVVNKASEQDCLTTPNTIFDISVTDQNLLISVPPGSYRDTVTVTVSPA